MEKILDYRQSLFYLERWNAKAALKLWSLKNLADYPLAIALGIRINRLNDLGAEGQIAPNFLTLGRDGKIRTALLVAGAEILCANLWQRHLFLQTETLTVKNQRSEFFRTVDTAVVLRVSLDEMERERILRKIRTGEKMEIEMTVDAFDKNEQKVAQMIFIWQLSSHQPKALPRGSKGET